MKPGTISEYMRKMITLSLYHGRRKINILIHILIIIQISKRRSDELDTQGPGGN